MEWAIGQHTKCIPGTTSNYEGLYIFKTNNRTGFMAIYFILMRAVTIIGSRLKVALYFYNQRATFKLDTENRLWSYDERHTGFCLKDTHDQLNKKHL